MMISIFSDCSLSNAICQDGEKINVVDLFVLEYMYLIKYCIAVVILLTFM